MRDISPLSRHRGLHPAEREGEREGENVGERTREGGWRRERREKEREGGGIDGEGLCVDVILDTILNNAGGTSLSSQSE